MGLLDDAIREHLELKRRHGADPGEVAREEAEALGPVRRDEAAAAPTAAAEPAPRAERAGLEEPGAAYAEEPAPYRAFEPAPEPEPSPDPIVHPGEEPVADPHDITPPHGDPLAHQPTREFTAGELEDALGRAPAPRASDPEVAPDEEEDVLEDTPDFLQETPEHDRLWFEQKPPKDFDF